MRIALFSGNYNYLREGANLALNKLVLHLEQRSGMTVRVYSPVTATPAFEPAGTLVPVPSIPFPVRSEFRLALGLSRGVRADLARFAPQLVHVSTPDILGCRAQAFARRSRIPLVASMHTRFETYLDYYGLSAMRRGLEWHLEHFYRRADHVLAPTEPLVADAKAMRRDNRASVWSRGIDGALFNPDRRDMAWRRQQGIADSEILILFLGRLVVEKGIAVYADVVRTLLRRGYPVRPLIIGAGPAGGSFEGLPGAIRTGHLSGLALARAVASADVLLTPSTTETFGNIILEAMASGLPVVSADAQNARSIIAHGVDGLLCPPQDVAAYADAVATLCDDSDLRRRMGARAQIASAAYSWDTASESVARVYRALIAPALPQ